MKRSGDRILTTHVGSLPRPADLHAMSLARRRGEKIDDATYAARVRQAVSDIVKKQVEIGIDIVDDGEMSKPSFITYINERLSGFTVDTADRNQSPWVGSREVLAFPDFYRPQLANVHTKHTHFLCTGPLAYSGERALKTDLENLKAALKGVDVTDAFVPSTSVSSIEDWNRNVYYKTDEEYLFALADAMGQEYRAIVDAGFLVQVDDPHLVTYYVTHPHLSMEDIRKWIAMRVDVINHALRGIPKEKVRFHTCYGINFGPRVHDIEVKHIIDILGRLNAGAFSFEAANPRHEHEYHLFESVKVPDGKVLVPGVITHASNIVEHPELIAERIIRFARLVGRENVIAGADCGFSSQALYNTEVHHTVVWEKFKAMRQGADLATEKLWDKRRAA
jgi:5-methyltetrahydropteroyltriglutamate--homocysteine methyltransferase